jgi:5'-nucleotidase
LATSDTRILVHNDDGYEAGGIVALAEAMRPLGEVWVVAPDREQSASSHSVSLHRPLRIREIRPKWYSVDGTPADCAYIALNHILKDKRPHLVVSGINHGANMADDVTYSGTVAAAREASLLGVPAIAFSLVSWGPFNFAHAAKFAHSFVQGALNAKLPSNMLLNVNIPGDVEPKGYVLTRLGKHSYGYAVTENVDPRGRKYYWIGGADYQHQDIPGSDCNAVLRDKRVSVTPLQLDLTHEGFSDEVRRWNIPGYQQGD